METEVELIGAAILTFREGKLARWGDYVERADALEAVGLSEQAVSQENVEIVRRSIEAFQHDEEAWLSTADPAFEWHPIEEGHIPSRGHEAAIGVRRRWLESWEGFQIDVEEMKDGASSVVACLHLTGQGKASGVEVDLRVYMHYKLRDGKVVYVYEYAERGEALEAAGLSE
jgi:ketosteroid isomerase-like protein